MQFSPAHLAEYTPGFPFKASTSNPVSSAIEGIRFIGGYLDGVDIEFSEHLNAIIGGRGTGKSTMLECIRYGLGLEPKTQNAIKQHKNIVDTNLGNERGMVEITLRSSVMHGRQFKISRKYQN